MKPANSVDRQHRKRHVPAIDELLHLDVGASLKLKVAFLRFAGKITCHGPVDINWEGIMPLYEIRVIAVHRAHEITDGSPHKGVQARGKAAGRRCQLDRQIFQIPTAFGEEWFNARERYHFADFYAARFIFVNIAIGTISCNHFAGPIADLVIARFPIHIGCMPPPEA
ncbi:hypothetical protein [Sinorhizobium medicae]